MGLYFSLKQELLWEEGELASWVGYCARTWGFVQPLPRYLALHRTTPNLSYDSGLCEAAISLLPSRVGVTSPLPRGRCSTAGEEGQVRTDTTTSKPVVWQSLNFYSSFLRRVQIRSDYTLNTPCLVQFGHKISAPEEKTDMKRATAWSNTSIGAVVSAAAWRVHGAEQATPAKLRVAPERAVMNWSGSWCQWSRIPLWFQREQDVWCGGQRVANHYSSKQAPDSEALHTAVTADEFVIPNHKQPGK